MTEEELRLSVLATRYNDERITAEAERDKLQAENLELDETCGKRQVRIYEMEAENKRLLSLLRQGEMFVRENRPGETVWLERVEAALSPAEGREAQGRDEEERAEAESLSISAEGRHGGGSMTDEELRLSVLATRYNDERIAAEARAEDLETLFRLQRTRMAEATKVWREATHKPDVVPDLGDLLAWLLSARKALAEALVLLAVPCEGLLADSESRRWIAPTLWAAMEEGVKAARAAAKEEA
jgi:hypothetical protein